MPTRRQVIAASAGAVLAPAVARAQQSPAIDVELGGKLRLRGGRGIGGARLTIGGTAEPSVALVTLHGDGIGSVAPDAELGAVFDALPTLETGVQLWRYAPWKAWTRPKGFTTSAELYDDDIQFLYWREQDGSFVAAVPLSGQGFRTTLGRVNGRFAARAVAGASAAAPGKLPLLAIGHGSDAHATISATYRAALQAMDRAGSAASHKQLPAPLRFLGWNSWNASDLGKKLNEDLLLSAARELRTAGVPIGWMTVDDGYFDHREQRLRSFEPDRTKFPNGFAPLIARLKAEHGIQHLGVWVALDGYWHGIDPSSPLGARYSADLFTWSEPSSAANPASPLRVNSFIRPDRPSMAEFYDAHLGARRRDGFDFVKVDNQLVVERMARKNFPVWTLATAMHQHMNAAAKRHFDNAIINCMDLTADAYFNFGETSVARGVEDYFPFKSDENYNLEKGNAAAHVLQAIYNALYVGEVAIPDFDMFESTNPNARLHAVARAANSGPIYVTDLPGQHDVALLRSLTLSDGRTLLADTPLLPSPACLFQLQDAKPFKAFSRAGKTPLLAVFNLADTDRVTGSLSAADVPGLAPTALVAYEHVSGRMTKIEAGGTVPVDLPRFGAQLWSLHRPASGFAAFGRSDKLNGVAAIRDVRFQAKRCSIALHELGPLAAFCESRPRAVTVAGQGVPFTWRDGLLVADVPPSPKPGTVVIDGGASRA